MPYGALGTLMFIPSPPLLPNEFTVPESVFCPLRENVSVLEAISPPISADTFSRSVPSGVGLVHGAVR